MTKTDVKGLIERLRADAQRGHIPGDLAEKRFLEAADALAALSGTREAGEPLQARVQPWMMACFGPEISADKLERSDRFVEEALELVQSVGYSRDRVLALVDYVFGREPGDPFQEVGGVEITLAAFCLTYGMDMHEAGEAELARIWAKIDKIRAKQAAKPTGSALPVAAAPAEVERGAVTDRISEVLDEGDGFWRSCSGCHELNEGHPTGEYNKAFRAHVGLGCSECGGLGVVWDDTDYAEMGDFLASPTPAQEATVEAEIPLIRSLEAHIAEYGETTEVGQDLRCAIEVIKQYTVASTALKGSNR